MPNAITLLEEDHRKMKKLLTETDSTTERGVKTRTELLATIKPSQWKYLRPDNGDMPEAVTLASASLGSRL